MDRRLKSGLAASVAALTLLTAGCGGKEERMQSHLEKGRALLDQGKLDVAGVEVRNAMQIDPKNSEAMFVAGMIIEKEGEDFRRAFQHFVRAAELDSNNVAARARVGRYYLVSGDIARAEETLAEITKLDAKSLDTRNLRAAVLAAKKDVPAAIEEATAILNQDPTQVETANFLAGLYMATQSNEQAVAVLDKSIAASPKNTALRIVRAAVAGRMKDEAAAEKQLREVIALEPARAEHRNNLAAFYARAKRLDDGETVLREGIAANKNDIKRRLALLEYLSTFRTMELAEKEARVQVTEDSRAYELQFQLARFLRTNGKADEAIKVYRGVIERDRLQTNGIRARVELAGMLLATGQRDEAQKLVDEVIKQNPRDNQALLMRAQFAVDRSDPVSAITDLRAVLRDQPDSPAIVGALARVHLINKEPELAREVIGRSVEMFPNRPQLRFVFAEYLASSGDFNGAMRQVDEVIKANSGSLEARDLKARIQLAQKNDKGAEETFREMKALSPKQPQVAIRLGQFYVAQKRFDRAVVEFEDAAKLAPMAFEPPLLVVNTLLAQGNMAAASARMEQAVKANPKSVQLLVAQGELAIQRKALPEAETAFRSALALDARTPASYVNLARISAAQGQRPAAIKWLQDGNAAMPDNNGMRLALAEFHMAFAEWEQAIKVYEELIKRVPDNLIAANNLAALLVEYRPDAESHKRALSLANRFETSDNAAFLDTLGRVLYKNGQNDQAVRVLRRAVERDPNAALHKYHLAMALIKRGEEKEARGLLQQAVESKTPFPGIEEARKILAAAG
jgi:tetratricopeptide (TPR) repeat protein